MTQQQVENYFYGNCSMEEQSRFEEWYTNNFNSKELNDCLTTILGKCTEDSITVDTQKAFTRLRKRILSEETTVRTHVMKPHLHWLRWTAAFTALIVMTAVAYFAGIGMSSHPQWTEVYVPYGEQRTIVLPDNSQVELQSGSKLIYAQNGGSKDRDVYLTGEGYFQVTKDRYHPFTVHSNGIHVTVLGTRFSVQAYQEDTESRVALYEGAVVLNNLIRGKQQERLMRPGDFVKIDRSSGKETLTHIEELDKEDPNVFYFIDMRLCDIARQLERHFGKRIIITSPELGEKCYFAVFANNETLDEILTSLGSEDNFHFHYLSKDAITIEN